MYPSLTSQITATYRDFEEVMCPLFHIRRPGNFALNNPQNPMSLVYKVSVSNDLQTFSDQVTLMAYDGNCVECNTTDLVCGYKVHIHTLFGPLYKLSHIKAIIAFEFFFYKYWLSEM